MKGSSKRKLLKLWSFLLDGPFIHLKLLKLFYRQLVVSLNTYS